MTEDRTQQMGGGPGPADVPAAGATQAMPAGAPSSGVDPQRTVIGSPMRALDLEAVIGSRYAAAANRSREHLLLMIRASDAVAGRRMPLNLCLVIDRSGSMEGEPLDYVKRACGYVVDLLEPTDVLSIVTFEESVDVLMPARRVVNKALIKEHINRIQPGNTTNLYDGMLAGCNQILSVNQPGYINRALILTDGEPTAGIKDFTSIVNQVQEMKNRGVTITALGFGSDYNEELMAGMARRSGGNYYYISQPALIPEVFRAEMQSLMTLTAKGLRMRLHLPRGVQVRYVYGVSAPQLSPRVAEYSLPDVERGATLANLVELEYEPHVPGTYRVCRAELHYDDAITSRPEAISAEAVVDFVADASLVETGRNPVVQRELEVHLASRNLEKTMMGMRTQQLSTAAVMQDLQRTKTILMQAGRTQQAQELNQVMDQMQRGGADVEKTLIGTIINLDKGKKSG